MDTGPGWHPKVHFAEGDFHKEYTFEHALVTCADCKAFLVEHTLAQDEHRCLTCEGRGEVAGNGVTTCPTCHGAGWVGKCLL